MKKFFDYSLDTYNTFGIASKAKEFLVLESIEDTKILENYPTSFYILGGGSNVILPDYIDKVVIHPHILGKSHTQTGNNLYLTIGAGENWHKTVLYTIEKGRRGIENLIAIPGNVGASPVQNIGAYGVELQDIFIQCTVYNRVTKNIEILDKNNCNFGYRHSVFKQNPGIHIVLDITIELSLQPKPIITYKPIQEYFSSNNIENPTQEQIATVIQDIRWSKLPKPEILGNCGSFFQNPIIDKEKMNDLLKQYPYIVHYPYDDGKYKLSAAWLIETAGLKGYTQGNIGTYEKQPLVIVNHGNCTKNDVTSFSDYIIEQIDKVFGVLLQKEVNIR